MKFLSGLIPHRSSLVLTLMLIGFMSLLLSDSFGGTSTSAKVLGTPAHNFIWLVITVFLVVRWKLRLCLPIILHRLLWLAIIPLLTVAIVLLSLYDYFSPLNQAFAVTRFHQVELSYVWIFSVLVALVNSPKQWWKKEWKKIIAVAPFVVFAYFLVAQLWPWAYFLEMVKEDRIVENLQFVILFGGGLSSFRFAWAFWRLERKWQTFALMGCGLIFMAVAGDEISWGQRLIGIETPTQLAEINRQEEITFHNLYSVEWLVGWGYFAIGLFGIWAKPLLSLIVPQKHVMMRLVPSLRLVGYFIFPAIFHIFNRMIYGGMWRAWSEVMELYIYAGVVIWIGLTSYYFLQRFSVRNVK